MAERKLELQPRLQALADWVRPGSRLADIGTDHGYLPVYLRKIGAVSHAIASDLRPAPLEHARRSAGEYGVSGIEFRLCNGLAGIGPQEADTIVIAGMGGENITAILEAASWALDGSHVLLLQPMSRSEVLRGWLPKHGAKVLRERLVADKGTLYSILEVTGGSMPLASPGQCYGGFFLLQDPLGGRYLDERMEKLRRAFEGLSRSEAPADRTRAEALKDLIAELQSMKGEWERADRS